MAQIFDAQRVMANLRSNRSGCTFQAARPLCQELRICPAERKGQYDE